LSVTPSGREAVARGRPYWAEAHARFSGFFRGDALAELRATLRDIASNPSVSDAFGHETDLNGKPTP